MTPATDQLKDLLAKASAAPWEAYNQPGDWGMMGAWYVNQEGQNPRIPLAMIEYETPYCFGASKRSVDDATRAGANATLIALAPQLAEEVVRLREALGDIAWRLADAADYDAGILNDWGGGNVDWWQDYLRAEIERANDFWRSQVDALLAARSAK